MRVLHVVKTSDGATWAALQAGVLVRHGVEVHVAVPSADGRAMPLWQEAGAIVHVADLNLPASRPWLVTQRCAAARKLVHDVNPDLIHSHFVSTTLLLRLALGRKHRTPRIFQVPGPLHLEHAAPRVADIRSAGRGDYWIGSSQCIVRKYEEQGIGRTRVFLSYYGSQVSAAPRKGYLRQRLGISESKKLVGNNSYIYPPKRLLGHRVGLKCHEDLIDALGTVINARDDVVGVLIGSTFGTPNTDYEDKLRLRARQVGRGRILMPGFYDSDAVARSWPDFDCAVHVPISENCGGVVEPILAGVPTIASDVGGLPEVVIDGVTGTIVPARDPAAIASAILGVLDDPPTFRRLAENGRRLVASMFDVERTGAEIVRIYGHILDGDPRPAEFCAREALEQTACPHVQ